MHISAEKGSYSYTGKQAIIHGDVNYLVQASAPDLTGNEVFEFSFWFRPSRISGTPDSIWKFLDKVEIEIGFEVGESDGYIKASTPSLSAESGNVLTDGTIYHAIIYFDGSELGLRINDAEIDTDTGASTGIAAQGSEVKLINYHPEIFSLAVDEFGYWVGDNLTALQRTALYNCGSGMRPTI